MSDEARQTLRAFVTGGDLQEQNQTPIPAERAVALREKLDTIRTDNDPPAALKATAAPSDFATAIRIRQQEAEEQYAASRGADVPRLYEDKPGFREVYKAHDVIATLPAPGGLALILWIIVVFFFVLIPATSKGETRMLLLWDVLLGKRRITTPIDEAEEQAISETGGDGTRIPPLITDRPAPATPPPPVTLVEVPLGMVMLPGGVAGLGVI